MAVADMMRNCEELIQQKNLVKREFKLLTFQFINTQKAMQYLAHQNEKAVTTKPSTKMNVKKITKRLGNSYRTLKLRRAVISVMFANRLLKMRP
jgi:hypothetical protein